MPTAAPKSKPIPPGPLRLPPGRSTAENRLTMRLRGHVTSSSWMPQGLSDELDRARDEHLRLRALAAGRLDELAEVIRGYVREDEEYSSALREAAREGGEAKDKRTPEVEREARRESLLDRTWASLTVLGDHIDAVIDLLRARETELLAGLETQVAEFDAERQEAQRVVERLRGAAYRVHRTAAWVRGAADESGVGRGQPAPTGNEPVPDRFDKATVSRPWFAPVPLLGATACSGPTATA